LGRSLGLSALGEGRTRRVGIKAIHNLSGPADWPEKALIVTADIRPFTIRLVVAAAFNRLVDAFEIVVATVFGANVAIIAILVAGATPIASVGAGDLSCATFKVLTIKESTSFARNGAVFLGSATPVVEPASPVHALKVAAFHGRTFVIARALAVGSAASVRERRGVIDAMEVIAEQRRTSSVGAAIGIGITTAVVLRDDAFAFKFTTLPGDALVYVATVAGAPAFAAFFGFDAHLTEVLTGEAEKVRADGFGAGDIIAGLVEPSWIAFTGVRGYAGAVPAATVTDRRLANAAFPSGFAFAFRDDSPVLLYDFAVSIFLGYALSVLTGVIAGAEQLTGSQTKRRG
jgi:hypothetical protein